ncbi:Ig-like domain-containing protein [Mycobacterium sp. NPDC006124]|uniref:Ig-like domain-containing protein n=1 Tax=Mycobacterium sp. NPDC006124 TaxID=3156729 RepID=UPI0033AD3927
MGWPTVACADDETGGGQSASQHSADSTDAGPSRQATDSTAAGPSRQTTDSTGSGGTKPSGATSPEAAAVAEISGHSSGGNQSGSGTKKDSSPEGQDGTTPTTTVPDIATTAQVDAPSVAVEPVVAQPVALQPGVVEPVSNPHPPVDNARNKANAGDHLNAKSVVVSGDAITSDDADAGSHSATSGPSGRVASTSEPAVATLRIMSVAQSSSAVVDARTPTATVAATDLAPPQPHLLEGVRTLVRNALALFGYTPGTPAPNPFLAAIWGLYRRVESTLDNQRPTVGAASVTNTSLSSDAHVVVTGTVSFTDEDGDPLSYKATNGAHGSVAVNPDGSFTYTSTDAGYTGTDTFTLTAADAGLHLHGLNPLGAGHTTTATVALTVTAPPNVAPVANDDAASTNEDTPLVIASATLLGNDSDPNGDTLVISAVGTAAHGTTALGVDGSITYTPVANYHGADAFSYTVSDGALNATATVTVTVAPVNDAPLIGTVTSTPGIGNTWEVTPTTSDVDGDAVTVTVGSVDATHVTATSSAGGSYTVTVTDLAWAKAHPGAQVSVLVTATDTAGAPVTKTVAIGTVNNTVALGDNEFGQLDIPALPAGVTYTQVSASGSVTVLLRSDGAAVAVGGTVYGPVGAVPALPAGVTYTQVSTTSFYTLLLRSDGTTVGFGAAPNGQLDIPALPAGTRYIQVSAGTTHAALLRSDGTAVAIGDDHSGQLDIPALPAGVTYTRVSAGFLFTVLLRSDGTAVAVGMNRSGESTVPTLPAGVSYTGVSTATFLAQYLRSDGTAVASLTGGASEADIPKLPAGVTFTQVAVGNGHTVWLRSDGAASVRGGNELGQSDIPALPAGVSYAQVAAGGNDTVLLTVVDVAPVAGDDAVLAVANAATVIVPNALLHNDSDPDGDPLAVTAVWGAGHGTTALGANGTITYTPTAGYTGTDTFNYLASDGVLGDAATVSVTITPASGAPVAHDDVATVAEGATATITLTANDTDADGTIDAATVVITRQPTNGTATVNANGTVTYASNGAEVTSDNFTYTVKDDAGLTSNAATVSITITPVDDPPVAHDDVATVAEGATATIALTANDTDADGTIDAATVVITRQPTNGTATVNSNGTVTYASNGAEVTSDGFTYTVKDNVGLTSNAATVSITINPVDDPPVGNPDSYSVAKGGTLTVGAAAGLLVNDSDVDGPELSVGAATGPAHGTLEVLSDGSFSYTPAANYTGSDAFTYQVTDGNALSAPVTVSITVTGINAPPVGNPDSYSIGEDATLAVGAPGVLSNDTDVDGPELFVSEATGAAHGALEVLSDGSFTYTPAANYYGSDSFTYQVSDGVTSSAPVTVTITITSVNDVPVTLDSTIPFPKNGYVGFSLANRSSDGDGDPLTGTLITTTQHGELYFNGTQLAFSYQPKKDFVGEDSFTYKVNDGTVDSNIATVRLVVS